MFVVEMVLRLGSNGSRLTDDEITDFIEMLVDSLDELEVTPSVGSRRVGDEVDLTIGVLLDEVDQFEALRQGAAIIRGALLAVIRSGAARQVMAHDDPLTSSVRILQTV
ncbi:MAG TPA: hypothetical protein VF244_00165 [Acidimicrobiales bacterium]